MKISIPAAWFLVFAPVVFAEAMPSPSEWIARARLFGSDERYALSIGLSIDEGGDKKERRIEVRAAQGTGDSYLLAAVVEPSFLSNMKYLRVKKEGAASQQWLKTSRGVSRVAGSGSGERVFGSHFTPEDFGDIDPSGFSLSFDDAGEGSAGLVRIAAVPVAAAFSYRKKIISIDTVTLLIVSVEYLDAKGNRLREYRLEETALVEGKVYPRRAVMRDLRSGGSTTLTVSRVERNPSLPARLFNPAGL